MESTILGEGQFQGEGDLGAIGAAIDSAGAGSVLQLRLWLPVPWPEWIGPLNLVEAISSAVRPYVANFHGAFTDGPNTLVIEWEA